MCLQATGQVYNMAAMDKLFCMVLFNPLLIQVARPASCHAAGMWLLFVVPRGLWGQQQEAL